MASIKNDPPTGAAQAFWKRNSFPIS